MNRLQRQQLANKTAQKIDRLGASSLREVVGIGRVLSVKIMQQVGQGLPFANKIPHEGVRDISRVLSAAMLASHLNGINFVFGMADNHRRDSDRALSVESVISALAKKNSVSDDMVQSWRERYNLRAVSETEKIAGFAEAAISKSLQESAIVGESLQDGVIRLRNNLDNAGVSFSRPYRYETIFRTEMLLAHSAGVLVGAKDPDLNEILWGWEYNTVGDDRVRPNHAVLDNLRLPKNDVRWSELMPPNGYSCRCIAVALFHGEEDAVTQDDIPDQVKLPDGTEVFVNGGPDVGWSFNPVEILG